MTTTFDETMQLLQWAKSAGATQVNIGEVWVVFGTPAPKSESDLVRERAAQAVRRDDGDARAYFDKQLFGGALDKAE